MAGREKRKAQGSQTEQWKGKEKVMEELSRAQRGQVSLIPNSHSY